MSKSVFEIYITTEYFSNDKLVAKCITLKKSLLELKKIIENQVLKHGISDSYYIVEKYEEVNDDE